VTSLVIVISAATVAALVGALAMYAILPHPLTRDERHAIVAQLVIATGLGVGLFRDRLPPVIAITVLNTLIVGGALLRAALLAPDESRPAALRVFVVGAATNALVFETMRQLGTPIRWRIVASSVFLIATIAFEFRNVLATTRGLRTRLPRALLLVDAALVGAHAWRIVFVVRHPSELPFLQQSGPNLPVFLSAVGSAVLGALAFIAIHLERLQETAIAAAARAARAEAERDATSRAHEATKRLLAERTDLIDLLAHEIRQPLNNASAALEAALEASRPDPAGASARALVRASDVLARVISTLNNTLAAATRLAEDTQTITRQPADLRDIVELARLSFDESRLERISMRIEALTTDAELDAALMQLAVRNLLDNALKFSPRGTPVHLVLDEIESGDWRVRVTNQGHLERPSPSVDVFDKRVRGVTGRSVEGAGLGLYIVRRVAELHGGRASMEEADGQVTVGFSFAGM
jgi:signal transduction histidine kinase